LISLQRETKVYQILNAVTIIVIVDAIVVA
jgi:hypothetical protein